MSIPSVVFGEASWYGSIRTGIQASNGDTSVWDGGSRFGVKGSSEVSDGLSAVYRFEHKLDSTSASLGGGGRLSYVGLSGGFGTITVGQIWSASFNATGAITDPTFAFGNSGTSYRHGSAISYAMSNAGMSLQIDAVMDSNNNSGNVDKVEFGLSMSLGEMATVAIAHIKSEDQTVMVDPGTYTSMSTSESTSTSTSTPKGGTVSVTGGNVTVTQSDLTASHNLTINNTLEVSEVKLSGSLQSPVVIGLIETTPAGQAETVVQVCRTLSQNGLSYDYADLKKPDGTYATTNCSDANGPLETIPAGSMIVDHPLGTTEKSGDNPLVLGDDGMPDKSYSDISLTLKGDQVSGVEHYIMVGGEEQMVTPRVVQRLISPTQNMPGTPDNDHNHTECVGTDADQNDCMEVLIYVDADGADVTSNVMHRGTADLGRGTLEVSGGELSGDVTLSGDITVTGGDVTVSQEDLVVSQDALTVDTSTDTTTTTTTTTTKDPAVSQIAYGSSSTFVAFQASLGDTNAYIGWSESESNAPGSDKANTMHLGAGGSMGDTGMSWLFQLQDHEDGSNPWIVGLSRSLGGGASLKFEHIDRDDGSDSSTVVALKVDF